MKRKIKHFSVYGALIAISYLFTGKLSLMLAIPPGYASAIFPPAGISMATALIFRKKAYFWIFIGSFLLNSFVGYSNSGLIQGSTLVAAAIIAGASLLQAVTGALLIRKRIGYPLAFDNTNDLVKFFVITPVVCLISSTLSVSGLVFLGIVQKEIFPSTWITWWIGDLLGVLITLPLTLTITGKPAALWRSRMYTVALPLLLTLALFVFVFIKTSKWEYEDSMVEFRSLSLNMTNQTRARFEEHESLLIDLGGFIKHDDSRSVTRKEFSDYIQNSISRFPVIQAVAWAPRVEGHERREFENKIRREIDGFEIREMTAQSKMKRSSNQSQYYPVLMLHPIKGNEAAIGFDVASSAERREAMILSQRSGSVAATAPLRLVTDRENSPGMLLMLTVRKRDGKESGVAIVAIRMENFMHRILDPISGMIYLRLMDLGTGEALYDNFSDPTIKYHFNQGFQFGSRRYLIQTAPTPTYVARQRKWQSWTVLVTGIFGTSLLGAILMLGTGHTARIESLVKKRSQELKESEEHFRMLFNSGNDAIMIPEINRDGSPGRFIEVNEVACRLLGFSREELLSMNSDDLVDPEYSVTDALEILNSILTQKYAVFERVYLSKEGRKIPVEVSTRTVRLRGKNALMSIIRDIGERRKSEEQIRHLAYYDILTDLPNRQLLTDRLRQALVQAKRYERSLAVLFLDLDRFKIVNDTAGHDTGDELLKIVAKRLTSCVRTGDTIARQGGDEFIIVLAEISQPEDAALIARKIIQALSEPIRIGRYEFSITTSIGIAIYPKNGTDDGQELMKKADQAMYRVKEGGRNGYGYYS